ncbi:MAG: ATP-binding protein [Rhodothermales bacterium]
MKKATRTKFEALRAKTTSLTDAARRADAGQHIPELTEVLDELHAFQLELETQKDELKVAQDRLAQMRSEYRHLFDFAPVGYLVFDADGVIMDINATAREMLGVTDRDLYRQPLLPFVATKDRRVFIRHLQDVIASKETLRCEIEVQSSQGETHHVEMVSSVIFSSSENDVLVRTALIDQSERTAMEQDLIREREKALQSARFMNEFMANMSHEIRTPLASVIGFADLLVDELPDEYKEMAELISSGGNRLLNTLNSVLDFARLQSRRTRVVLKPTDVSKRVEHQCRLMQPLLGGKDVELTFATNSHNIIASLDGNFLDRILNNLIGNAIKYTEQGAVHVDANRLEDWAEIVVSDTGIGIDTDFRPHLFEPFHQEHMGSDRPYEGVGLGLAITNRLVQLMGGEIEVDSEKGKGSVFRVRFPLLKKQNAQETPTLAEVQSEERKLLLKDKRILAVEDNRETRMLVEILLGKQMRVDAVRCYDEALEHYRNGSYDALLIDINLGEKKTGIDLLQYVMAHPPERAPYCIAFTAYALPTDQEKYLELGFDDYLSKPFTHEALNKVLDRFLDSRSLTEGAEPEPEDTPAAPHAGDGLSAPLPLQLTIGRKPVAPADRRGS